MRKNRKVCVQVEHVESESQWHSVMCWGGFEEVTDSKNIQDVKLLFGEQRGASVLKKEATPVSPMVEDLHLVHDADAVVYRMRLYRITEKANRC